MIKEAIASLVIGQSMTSEQASQVMAEIMEGKATPAQFGAFVTALRLKGETVDEIIGLAQAMRARATAVSVTGALIDTCGTGGDAAATFNISTTAAFVVAGAGLKVAKHGNRAMSSQCGSADVLEALGVKIDLSAEQVGKCIEEAGIGFMFAPVFHPAMKFAGQLRREIGIRTVFNILGPLTNPAKACAQVLGVAAPGLVQKMALALRGLGCRHAVVVHGEDGLDEITIADKSQVCEVKDGAMQTFVISPEDLGLKRAKISDIKGGTAQENADILCRILNGECGPRRDVVLLNAAAALLAGDRVANLSEGVSLAAESIDKGLAVAKLDELVKFSQNLSGVSA